MSSGILLVRCILINVSGCSDTLQKRLRGLWNLPYLTHPEVLNIESIEDRRLHMDLMCVYKLLMGCLILMPGNILHRLILSHVDTDIKSNKNKNNKNPGASILLHSV